jgi:response regulator RpfG family c-di-GMP phosphodiesterase
MSPEETDLYHRYPHLSMNIVLDRKIGLSEKMRNALMAVHERANGKGFPKGILGHKLPLESQMIQFCKDFDQRTVLRMGKARVDQKEIRDQLVEEDFGKETRFTQAFLESLKRGFGAGPAQPLE